jgi:NADPH-dependent 2,4-dienoyl-CoA reductase/sulfur reductase-like enzyme
VQRHILIVGASLGGLRTAEQLRALGFDGTITIVGAEDRMPYNRPPLSKDVLYGGKPAAEAFDGLAFRLKPALSAVIWRLGTSVAAVDLARSAATLSTGETIAYDGLVIAAGLRPRRLAVPGCEADRFALRTFDDALTLRDRLKPGARVAVIGAGFIGSEVAASARRLGCRVTVIEPAAAPMERAIGRGLGRALQRVHEAEGVAFHIGRAVAGFEAAASGRLRAVQLDSGERIAADLVVEAVGSLPNAELLAGNCLDLSDGVLCDNRLRIGGWRNAVAVGDVARFPNPFFDHVPRRIEHWSMPGATAKRAAATLARHVASQPEDPEEFAPIPTFWSDQYELRIQSAGMPPLGDSVELLEGSLAADEMRHGGAALGYRRGGRLVGVATVAMPPARLAQFQARLVEERQAGLMQPVIK